MEISYCEKTGKKTYAIHLNEEELGLTCDLFNSSSHPGLKKLKDSLNNLIRSENVFHLFIKEKLLICESCSGHGKILKPHQIMFESTVEKCQTCQGSGKMKLTAIQRWEPYNPQSTKHMLSFHHQKPLKFTEQ